MMTQPDMIYFFPDFLEYLSQGYDLIRGHLSKKTIKEAINEISEYLEDDPDDLDLILSLDALYSAIGEDIDAIDILLESPRYYDHPLLVLRRACHSSNIGESDQAQELMESLISYSDSKSILSQLCALVAVGLRDDRDEFARRWKSLREHVGEKPSMSVFEPLNHVDGSSVLNELSFQEHIFGIDLLISFGITDGLSDEVFSLISDMEHYCDNVIGYFTLWTKKEGTIILYPLFSHLVAISAGALRISKKYLRNKDLITDPNQMYKIHKSMDRFSYHYQSMQVAEKLTDALLLCEEIEDGLLPELRKFSSDSDDPIISMLSLFSSGEMTVRGNEQKEQLMEELLLDNPENHQLLRMKFRYLIDHDQIKEAVAFGNSLDEEVISLKERAGIQFDLLMDEEKYEEALSLLAENPDMKNSLEKAVEIFDYIVDNEKTEFFALLSSILNECGLQNHVLVLNGLERILKKDVKSGQKLVDQAIHAGYSEKKAMLVTARYMIRSGFGKRAVGVCEKLLKRNEYSKYEIYEVMAEAYSALGKEHESAQIREKKGTLSGNC